MAQEVDVFVFVDSGQIITNFDTYKATISRLPAVECILLNYLLFTRS